MNLNQPDGQRQLAVHPVLFLMLVAVIALVPLWSTDIPPLLDYPQHLARQYVIFRLDHTPVLQQFYRVQWTAIPYLAMDAVVLALSKFLAVDVASKIFVSLTLLLVAIAPLALNLALYGRITPIALLGPLFVHNQTLLLGFVNYVFSAAFAVCLFALWIRFRSGSWRIRIGLFPVLATLLFFSHLLGLLLYGVLAGAYELGAFVARIRDRNNGMRRLRSLLPLSELGSLALQAAVPITIYLVFGPGFSAAGENTYGGLWRKLELLGGLFFNLIQPYAWKLDRALAITLTTLLVLLAAAGRIRFPRRMLWPIGAMVLLVIAMPMELFSGYGTDHRMLLPLGILLAGSVEVRRWSRRGWWLAVVILATLTVTRVVTVTLEWRRATVAYAEYQQAIEVLTDGSKVYYAFGHAGGPSLWPHPRYAYPSLALRDKAVYLPYLFTSIVTVLRYTDDYEPLQRLSAGPVLLNHESPDWPALIDTYDYFVLTDEHLFDMPVPSGLVPVYQGRNVRVYRNPLAG